ncbi:hypothetical protein AMTR_s00017p00018180 [Amborella trichopoda]|uniref:Uncharacterized protein n=1 Tax=Amborella trichopoda TaxID=13333 RepID=W1PEW9_AMBTC|nr:hypothetical protein AMTR_s00017p00018180 [Amborella trichopoda]
MKKTRSKNTSQIRDKHDRLQYCQIGEHDPSHGLPSKEYETWYVQVFIPRIYNPQNPWMDVYTSRGYGDHMLSKADYLIGIVEIGLAAQDPKTKDQYFRELR